VPLAGGRFIADFYAPALRLIVEVDGSVHEHKRRADARRDEKLRRLGLHVFRIDAALVIRQPEEAVALVRAAVDGFASGRAGAACFRVRRPENRISSMRP
jgi:very-short-patch-repair endonuclease